MSGIFCIFNFDGAPVEPQMLRLIAEFMAFRGPDEQETWIPRRLNNDLAVGAQPHRKIDFALASLETRRLSLNHWLKARRCITRFTLECFLKPAYSRGNCSSQNGRS